MLLGYCKRNLVGMLRKVTLLLLGRRLQEVRFALRAQQMLLGCAGRREPAVLGQRVLVGAPWLRRTEQRLAFRKAEIRI